MDGMKMQNHHHSPVQTNTQKHFSYKFPVSVDLLFFYIVLYHILVVLLFFIRTVAEVVASDSKQQTKRKCFHGKRPVYNRIAVTKGKKEIIKQKKEFTIECTTMVVNIRRVAYVAPDMKNEAKRVIIPPSSDPLYTDRCSRSIARQNNLRETISSPQKLSYFFFFLSFALVNHTHTHTTCTRVELGRWLESI
jgi:hypothetical protein